MKDASPSTDRVKPINEAWLFQPFLAFVFSIQLPPKVPLTPWIKYNFTYILGSTATKYNLEFLEGYAGFLLGAIQLVKNVPHLKITWRSHPKKIRYIEDYNLVDILLSGLFRIWSSLKMYLKDFKSYVTFRYRNFHQNIRN